MARGIDSKPSRWLTRPVMMAAALLYLCGISAQAQVYFTTTNAVWKLFKGYSEASTPLPTLWRQPAFDDASWLSSPAPFYYSDTATEPPFYTGGPFAGTVMSDMINNYTTVFFRKTFVVTNAAGAGPVTVQIAGDDGFIVWLNGAEVNRTNVPAGFIPYNGTAVISLPEPYPVHSFVLSNGPQWLREGTNVLAVHGINSVSNSHDFGFMAGLSVAGDFTSPTVAGIDPLPGLTVADLTSIRVVFSEPVTNVDVADLRVNNLPATNVT